MEAPAPQGVLQLRSFLVLVNYDAKFLPRFSSILALLYRLLQSKVQCLWETTQQAAFDEVKEKLASSCLLTHYDPSKELCLSCDASPYRLGAVLSHRLADGSERPIAYASRTLAPAERKYSQMDKKGLAIIFGVNIFHHISWVENSLYILITSHFSTNLASGAQFHQWLLPVFKGELLLSQFEKDVYFGESSSCSHIRKRERERERVVAYFT